MLLFKKTDVYGQATTIIGSALLAFCGNVNAFYGYFIVGGWQVVSTILNLVFAKKFPLVLWRNQYHRILGIIAIVALISVLNTTILFSLVLCLFFFSPLLAIWYNYISYRELKNWEAKVQVHFR